MTTINDDDNDDLYIIGAVCMYVCMYVSKSHYLCIQRIYFSRWDFFFLFRNMSFGLLVNVGKLFWQVEK